MFLARHPLRSFRRSGSFSNPADQLCANPQNRRIRKSLKLNVQISKDNFTNEFVNVIIFHYIQTRQPYSFSWSVFDKPSFQEYSHSESSDGKVTTGSYRVYLPDGRIQTVTYTADAKNGYRADVKYENFSKTGTWIPGAIGFQVVGRS